MSMECQRELSKSDVLFRIQSLEEALADAVKVLRKIKHETIRSILDDGGGGTDLSDLSPDMQSCIDDYDET